jgi:hypothetical protein
MGLKTMNWTEVTDVDSIGNPTKVWLGRTRHYINSGDKLTFRGDSRPDMLENGVTYTYIGKTKDEPNDSIYLEHQNERIKLYRTDFDFYLMNGCFEIHDA